LSNIFPSIVDFRRQIYKIIDLDILPVTNKSLKKPKRKPPWPTFFDLSQLFNPTFSIGNNQTSLNPS